MRLFKIFELTLLLFSIISLIGACGYYGFKQGYYLGEFTGAKYICENNNKVLGYSNDSNKIYKCINKEEEQGNNFYIELNNVVGNIENVPQI